ncbi:hypothetical protein [Frigidibacter sp. MR17.24]|uniref:hypothetical protein n=1 Tax=Frigidibacter sp. MR17.24 TaxID=3127345 RepID=UPI003012CCBF
MDLASFDLAADASRGAELHLQNPITLEPLFTEDGQPITIRLLGGESREFRAAASDLLKAAKGKLSIEAGEARSAELLSKITVAWSNIVFDGETLDCTPANAARLYRARPWIRKQVDEFVADVGNFSGTGATA